jgi:hypothetical protein
MITAMLYAIAALFWAVVGFLGVMWIVVPVGCVLALLVSKLFGR